MPTTQFVPFWRNWDLKSQDMLMGWQHRLNVSVAQKMAE